jgi:UMF1 family MFS transporter
MCYLYDFGNSSYAAVILLVFGRILGVVAKIPVFLNALWNYHRSDHSSHRSYALTILIAVFPNQKKFYSYSQLSLLIRSVFVGRGYFHGGAFILLEIGYRASQVFYDSLLVDVSTPETIGRISGNGWAVGMLGGIACLVIVLLPIQMVGGALMVRLAFVITAVFFLLSAIPIFLNVRQVNEPEVLPPGMTTIRMALKKLTKCFGMKDTRI